MGIPLDLVIRCSNFETDVETARPVLSFSSLYLIPAKKSLKLRGAGIREEYRIRMCPDPVPSTVSKRVASWWATEWAMPYLGLQVGRNALSFCSFLLGPLGLS
jgi:hypothetical protein